MVIDCSTSLFGCFERAALIRLTSGEIGLSCFSPELLAPVKSEAGNNHYGGPVHIDVWEGKAILERDSCTNVSQVAKRLLVAYIY